MLKYVLDVDGSIVKLVSERKFKYPYKRQDIKFRYFNLEREISVNMILSAFEIDWKPLVVLRPITYHIFLTFFNK